MTRKKDRTSLHSGRKKSDAFNSEDERLFGHFFDDEKSEGKKENRSSDEELTSDDDSDGDSDSEDTDDEEDDGGQYMLDLLNNLDGSNKEESQKSEKDLSLAQMVKIPESEYSNSICEICCISS